MLLIEPGRPPRLMTLPWLHSVAYMEVESPTACPALLMLRASLCVEPGRPSRLMTLPPLHSVAQRVHLACAEPAVSPSRQAMAKMASPNVLKDDMSPSPTCKGAEARASTRRRYIPPQQWHLAPYSCP